MKKSKMANSIIVLAICSIGMGIPVLAENSLIDIDKARGIADETESKISESLKKAHNYVDDSLLTAKVKSALIDAKEIKGHQISVTTRAGVVSLQGVLSNKEQAQLAVSLAQGVEGVKDVNDQISLMEESQQGMGGYVSDMALTAEIKAKLLVDSMISSRYIHVETCNGMVTLSGYVTTKEQLQRIANIVNTVTGVKEVSNNLEVKSF